MSQAWTALVLQRAAPIGPAAYRPKVMATNDVSPLMLSVSGARGIVGKSMTPEVAGQLAAAFARELSECSVAGGIVVVGRDGRPSGAALEDASCESLARAGWRVVRLGVVATPTSAVMVTRLQAAGGVVITASHNPGEWNGVKFLTAQGAAPAPPSAQRIIDRFRSAQCAGAGPRADSACVHSSTVRSGRESINETADDVHVQRVLAHVDVESIRSRRFRVVLDSVNGGGCRSGRLLLERLGADVIHLNGEPTGLFAHRPEPTRENLTDLAAAVVTHRADVGFAQDPDADRLAIIDEAGRYIGEEYTFVLAAEEVLEVAKARSGAKRRARAGAAPDSFTLAVNLSSSRMIDDVAASHGARVIRTPVGEANVVEAMQRHGCVLGGEGNGGVIWPPVCLVRDSLGAMALALSLLARRGAALSRIADNRPTYFIEKFKVPLRPGLASRAFSALGQKFPEASADHQDGLRLDWPDRGAWLHVRASNTEPILRLIAEAREAAHAQALLDETARLVSSL